MKRANWKRQEAFDAAQARLRLLIAALQNGERISEDDLESLDFTSIADDQTEVTAEEKE
jgi:hypothetical protein